MNRSMSEVLSQPDSLERLARADISPLEATVAAMRRRNVSGLMIAARGSSGHAARYAGYLFGIENRLVVNQAMPSITTLYQAQVHVADTCVVAISQSGQSQDLVSVLTTARAEGALTVVITNCPESPLARAAEHVLDILAGPEESVLASKSYTAELLMLARLSALLARDERRLVETASVPSWVADALALAPRIAPAAERYRCMDRCAVLGRGFHYPAACELSLKLKEACYVLAMPSSMAEFLHGAVVMVRHGLPVFAIMPSGRSGASMTEHLRDLRDRGADLCILTDSAGVGDKRDCHLPLPSRVPEWLSPITTAVAAQLFSLELAALRGLDPDHPRGLNKVTSTK